MLPENECNLQDQHVEATYLHPCEHCCLPFFPRFSKLKPQGSKLFCSVDCRYVLVINILLSAEIIIVFLILILLQHQQGHSRNETFFHLSKANLQRNRGHGRRRCTFRRRPNAKSLPCPTRFGRRAQLH